MMKIPEAPPVLHTGNIYLRQLSADDIAEWYAYLSMPEAIQHTSWNLACSADLLPFLNAAGLSTPTSPIRLAIIDADQKCLAGTVGFHTVSDINRSAEITYDLAPRYWGQGIGPAVCSAMTAWGHTARGFLRIQATVLETNTRSESVLRKCGYQYEGLLHAYRLVRGQPGNFKMFAHVACSQSHADTSASGG